VGATRAAGRVPEATAEWLAVEQIIKLQLRRWVVDEDDLEDMTQECLAKVWLKSTGASSISP
jgi:DNA-directed RNA polymerase specialized sigma24 family protein